MRDEIFDNADQGQTALFQLSDYDLHLRRKISCFYDRQP